MNRQELTDRPFSRGDGPARTGENHPDSGLGLGPSLEAEKGSGLDGGKTVMYFSGEV